MSTKPVFSASSLASGGANHILISLFHAILLGAPLQRYVIAVAVTRTARAAETE